MANESSVIDVIQTIRNSPMHVEWSENAFTCLSLYPQANRQLSYGQSPRRITHLKGVLLKLPVFQLNETSIKWIQQQRKPAQRSGERQKDAYLIFSPKTKKKKIQRNPLWCWLLTRICILHTIVSIISSSLFCKHLIKLI